MKRFILWVTMLLFAQDLISFESFDWFMFVISEINDPSKEVNVRFMRTSGQYFLLSKKLEKWFPKSAIFHICSIPSTDNHMCYSFDAIDDKRYMWKIKTLEKEVASKFLWPTEPPPPRLSRSVSNLAQRLFSILYFNIYYFWGDHDAL